MTTNVQAPLQKNTADLLDILQQAMDLPDAGGGGDCPPCPEFTTEELTVTPTKSQQVKTPTADGYSKVTVEPIPSQFIVPTGRQTLTENKTYNVSELEEVVVDVPAPTPTYDTPSINVSNGGLITASANGKSNTQQLSTQAGKTVTPTKAQQTAVASQRFTTGDVLVAPIPDEFIVPTGSKDITENGNNIDVSGVATVNVNVPTGGGGSAKNVQAYIGTAQVTATSYTATAVKLTVAKTGTYRVSWMGWRNTNSGTSGSQLYINNSAYGSANTTFTNTYGHAVTLNNVQLTEGQEIVVRARARSTSYVMAVGNLVIEEV